MTIVDSLVLPPDRFQGRPVSPPRWPERLASSTSGLDRAEFTQINAKQRQQTRQTKTKEGSQEGKEERAGKEREGEDKGRNGPKAASQKQIRKEATKQTT